MVVLRTNLETSEFDYLRGTWDYLATKLNMVLSEVAVPKK